LHSIREYARTELVRAASKISSSCDTYTGRRAIKFLGAQLCATARLYIRLLPGSVRYCTTTSYYFQKDVRGITLLLFFLHQLTIDYFNQLNMSTFGNNTADASGTSPASRYNLNLSHLFVVFVLFLYKLSANTNNFYATIILLILNNNIILLLDFEIKIYCKIPKHLTYLWVKLLVYVDQVCSLFDLLQD
jgi:hypothetical protein